MSSRATLSLELARMARRERTFWLRTVYVAFLSTVVALAWLAKSTGETDWSRQEHVGHALFVIFAWVQFVMLMLAAPISLCGAVSEEKSRRTLPVLLASPLSSLDIVFGKLLGGLIPVGLLLLAGLPIMFLLLVFGGLSPWEVVASFLMTVACATLAGAAALFFSGLVRTAHAAFGLAAVFICAYALLPQILDPTGMAAGRVSGWYNCFTAFAAVLSYGHVPEPALLVLPVGVAAAVVLALLFGTALPLRRLAAAAEEGGRRGGLARRRQRLLRIGRRPRGEPVRPETGNPVALRELGRTGEMLAAALRLLVGGGLCLAGAVWFCYPQLHRVGSVGPLPGQRWFLALLESILVGLPLMAGARGFALEWERQTLDLLLASPLTGREIVLGKFAAASARMAPLGVLPLVYTGFFISCRALPTWSMMIAWLEWFVFGAFLLALAVISGLLVRRTARIACAAVGLAFGLDLLLLVVWIPGQILGWVGSSAHAFAAWWLAFGWAELLTAAPKHLVSLWVDLAVSLGAHLLFAGVLLLLASRFFDRLTGRVA